MRDILRVCDDSAWDAQGNAPTRDVESIVESGVILCFPRLRFNLAESERPLLDAAAADGKAKNISLRGASDEVRGAAAHADVTALRSMMQRYRTHATALAERLFPTYRSHLGRGNTTYRPLAVEGRTTSWRSDDTRLHVDAFPSNPMRGKRLLRVFHNLHPAGQPRRWITGEPFEDVAPRYLPSIRPALPGSSALLHALRITKSRRSAYDHYMLQLHDRLKADATYQRDAPQRRIDFQAGTTWVLFSDQVVHAAIGGQFLIEQTFYLDPQALIRPPAAPLAVLERLLGRTLL